jgi:hypothetical protein
MTYLTCVIRQRNTYVIRGIFILRRRFCSSACRPCEEHTATGLPSQTQQPNERAIRVQRIHTSKQKRSPVPIGWHITHVPAEAQQHSNQTPNCKQTRKEPSTPTQAIQLLSKQSTQLRRKQKKHTHQRPKAHQIQINPTTPTNTESKGNSRIQTIIFNANTKQIRIQQTGKHSTGIGLPPDGIVQKPLHY